MVLYKLISLEFITAELYLIPLPLFIIIYIIHNSLSRKTIDITQKERQHYACISCEKNHWVEKCYSYMNSIPTLFPNVENMPELKKDFEIRNKSINDDLFQQFLGRYKGRPIPTLRL